MIADVTILIAIAFANLPPDSHKWFVLLLILVGGLLLIQLNRENTIRKSRQIVITAIKEKFETQRKACEEIKNKSSNPSFEEIQQIIQNIDIALAQLYQQYKECLQIAQSGIDKELFEQVKADFFLHALTNQERLVIFAQQINQFDFFLCQQNLIRPFNQQSETLMIQIKQLIEICSLSVWTAKLNALKSELETFMDQTVSKINRKPTDIQQLEIKHNFEVTLKDFSTKVEECKRTIQQKRNILKNITKCFNQIKSKYALVFKTLPDMPDEDFLDFENLKTKVDPVKSEAEAGFQCK
jgi:hypothetical protein